MKVRIGSTSRLSVQMLVDVLATLVLGLSLGAGLLLLIGG